ncbi:hypothetical protein K6U06_23075 [Acidiferrimicrobium sp. IK]|uniref:hypothetical protein n=1 Tax=Acidiferrimicrobium sp. IK TaxID=2871700 RepID=UPI0021CAEB2C|nr:hypothetical protein [Acidiferrimicrobium sp. IK]MCU4187264.1 hypothetical protein [Acidiferrimicrobium sp. IK]
MMLLLVGGGTAFAAYGPTGGATVTASTTTAAPGQPIALAGSGFAPSESISIVLHSTPVQLATVQATPAGTFSTTVTIPTNTTPGQHEIIATGLTSGVTATFPITIVGSSAATAPAAATTSGASSGGGSSLAFTGADIAASVAVGVGALAVGGLLTLSSRKRRSASFQ